MDDDTLLVSGQNEYFAKSYDMGGALVSYAPPGIAGYSNFDLQVVDGSYYILSVQGTPYEHNEVLKSTDRGLNWQVLYDTIGLFTTLTMLDTTYGVIGGTFGSFASTTQNDYSWKLDTLYSSIVATQAYGDSTVLMMSLGSMSYLTHNRGQYWTWVSGTSTNIHERIQFVTEDTIYVASHTGTSNPKSFFHYSTDGGYSWSSIDLAYNSSTMGHDYYSRVFDLYFDSPRHGYMLGYNYDINEGIIFETNNYGVEWTMHPIGTAQEPYSLLCINDSVGFIGGQNGLLLKWDMNQPITGLAHQSGPNFANISVYPNPVNDILSIKIPSNQARVQFINALGQVVLYETITQYKGYIDVSNLTDGVYVLQIESNFQTKSQPILISH